jgi:hypothetical protein
LIDSGLRQHFRQPRVQECPLYRSVEEEHHDRCRRVCACSTTSNC